MFLGVLFIAWIVVLVPPVLRARNDSRNRGDSIGDFQNRLGVLGHTHFRQARRAARAAQAPRGDLAPMPGFSSVSSARRLGATRTVSGRFTNRVSRPSAARPLTGPVEPVRTRAAERSARRRREVVTVLFTATMLTAAVASAMGGPFWGLQILSDLLLLTYVAGMLWFKSNGIDRARTVRYLPPVRPRPVPAYALRRTASS
ncbi:MAG: hypothetical protein QOI08_273 [Actinomycetota bacterium]|nr:hypothetical protein [Actinomycetota bacterium]